MSDSYLYLNLLDAKAKSELGSQRHVRCEAGEEEDGGWDCRYSTVYFILYILYYTILLNYILDGGWDCRYWPRHASTPKCQEISKKDKWFFSKFLLRLVHSVIGVYEWKANVQAITNDYNYNLISNYTKDWPYQLDMSCTSSMRNQKNNHFSMGIEHWALGMPFYGCPFPFPSQNFTDRRCDKCDT